MERELADALTALAMLGDKHERELAQSKEANAGLMRACENLESEIADAKETIAMLEIRHGATMLCHQAQMDEITKQRDELGEHIEANHRIGLIRERELAEAKKENERLNEVAAEHITRYHETCLKLETALFGTEGDSFAQVAKQRDELAAALKSLCIAIISEEPRDITDLLKQSGAAIAATKGGQYE